MNGRRQRPKVFVSYSWDDDEHRDWVRTLAQQLRVDGLDVILDQWHVRPGDELTQFMENSVRDNDFVLVICTPRYKEKSDTRVGGVGYEGNIMTAEVFAGTATRKFIPILRRGVWKDAAPSWLAGKYYVDLSGTRLSEPNYSILLATLRGEWPKPPPVGQSDVPISPTQEQHRAMAFDTGRNQYGWDRGPLPRLDADYGTLRRLLSEFGISPVQDDLGDFSAQYVGTFQQLMPEVDPNGWTATGVG